MKARFLTLATAVLLSTSAFAGTITGTTKNAESKPVAGITMLLLRASDSSLVKTAISDEAGQYAFEGIAAGNYLIRVQAQGYDRNMLTPVMASADGSTNQDVALQVAKKELDGVAVRAQRPLIEAYADKVVVNVESSIANTGSTAFDVLQRAPGVNVDNNDNISLKGKQGVNIIIDGRLVPVQGVDLANLLKGMPSGSIDKIELISNPGAKYDAAGTAGVINIKTKKEKRAGANGSITAGVGQGVYPKWNAGINLNYRTKKWNVFGNYNYDRRQGYNELILDRRFYNNNVLTGSYQQHNYGRIYFHNQTASAGVDYTLSPMTTIGAVVSAGDFGYRFASDNHSTVLSPDGNVASFFTTSGEQKNGFNNATVNLNLRQKLDTSGSELTVDADYGHYNNTTVQTVNTAYILVDGTPMQPDYRLYGTLDGFTDIKSIKADYSHPFKGNAKIEAGVKSSYVTADNNPAFWDRSTGVDVFDSTKSNHFIYSENINAAYVNASKDWTKWSAVLGLRAEQTVANGHQLINDYKFDRNYTQLFPSLALTRHLNANHDLGITISRRIQRPNYQQLNPFKRYMDPSSVHEGNPYLNPALTWSVELSHTFKNKFLTQFSYSRTTDDITQVILPEAGQVAVITEKNLATTSIYNLSGNYPLTIAKWWNTILNLNLYYSHYEGNLANTPLSDGTPAATLTTQNTFTLPYGWTAELMAWYQSPQRYGYMSLESQSGINGGVQKQLFKKAATLKIGFTDLFHKQNPLGDNNFSSYKEHFVVLRDTRTATASFTYRFGKRAPGTGRHRRGAEEELQRAGASGG